MNKKNRYIIVLMLICAMCLNVCMKLNVNAEEQDSTKKKEEKFIDYLKNRTEVVKYDSIESLYKLLEDKQNITEEERTEILGYASDKVIDEFISNEQKNCIDIFLQINSLIQREGFDTDKTNIESEKECELSVDEKCYMSGNNMKKTYTTKTKYGTKIIRELCVEKVDSLQRSFKYELVDKFSESTIKPYGKYKFKFQDDSSIGDLTLFQAKTIFVYEISQNGLKALDLVGHANDNGNWGFKIQCIENTIKDYKANKSGENIDGTVVYEFQELEYGHITHYKQNVVVAYRTNFPNHGHMLTEHYVAEYEKKLY